MINTNPSRGQKRTIFAATDTGQLRPASVSEEWGPWSEWRTYFYTHQPSEWWTNADARSRFQEIYGAKALTTLDWTCTIPENINSIWVTNRPLDDTGKPLPQPIAS